MSIHTDMALRKTIAQYAAQRDRIVSMVQDAYRALRAADQQMQSASGDRFVNGLPYKVRPELSLEEATAAIDRQFWRACFNHTGLAKLMDAQARREFEASLERPDVPTFSEKTIRATFIATFQDAEMMLSRSLFNLWKDLDRTYYRTNGKPPSQLGRKVIINHMVEERFAMHSHPGLRINYRQSQFFNDIDRAFRQLDNNAPFSECALESAVNTALADYGTYEDEYFKMRGFKAGTLHLWFKRQDLLDAANRRVSEYTHEKALADARSAADGAEPKPTPDEILDAALKRAQQQARSRPGATAL